MKSTSHKTQLLILTCIYIVSQIMLCLISGIWWDDWFFFTNSHRAIMEHCIYFGYPWEALNIFSVIWIPGGGYRIVVFLVYLATGLLFYEVLRNIDFFTETDAFWISAVAMTAPVNDARTILICYGYGLSLCLFMAAFYIITRNGDMTGKKKYILRGLSLLLLIVSYLRMESLLVFTGLIWLYLLYRSVKRQSHRGIAAVLSDFIRSGWDYCIFPFIAFFLKNSLTSRFGGELADYKEITFDSMLHGIVKSPVIMLRTGLEIGYSYYSMVGIASVIVFVLVSGIYIIRCRKTTFEEENKARRNIVMFLLGVLVYYAGGFAYIVFHEGRLDVVRYNNVGGRDAILLGFGIAIMAYSFAKFIPAPPYVRNLIPILMIVLGSFYFTDKYLDYQEDWINTREFSVACENATGLDDADTVLVDFLNYSPCDGRRSSTLNGASYLISGRKNRFFIDNSSVWASPSMISDKLSEYICDEYDPSDVTIDGVLLIDNYPVSNTDLIRLRFCELFRKDEFERAIESMTAARYIPVSKEISDELYSLHEEGKLTGEELRSRW